MRALKVIGIVVAAFAGIVLLAVVAVFLWVDPNAYRGDIERLALQKTGRPLRIGGKLDLKLFPYLAISIADVTLGNPPGYGSNPFLKVHQASVGVRLLPLLRKRLEVSRVSVDGLAAELVSRSASDNNWQDLTESKGDATHGGGGESPQTSIAGVDIKNSSLMFRDTAKKTVTALSNLQIQTGALGGSEPVRVSVEFDYGDGGKKPVAHFSVSSQAQLPNGSPRVALNQLDVHGDWFGDAPKGDRPLTFGVRSAAVVLDTQAQTLAPATFEVKLGDLAAQLSATGEKLFTDRIVTGRLTVPQVSARKALESLGITAPVTRDASVLATLAISSDYRATPKQMRLTNLVLTLDDTHVRGAAAIDDLDTMALSYDLNVDRINVDRYLAPKAPAQKAASGASSARAAASAPTPLPIETLRKLNAHGTLQVGNATVAGLAFTGVSLPLAAKDGRVHLGPTQAHLFGGAYNGDVVLDAGPAQADGRPAQLSLNEHVKGVDAGELMKAAFETTRISGHGDANVVVTGVGNTDADILRSLSGKIDVDVKEGAINGVDLWYELRRAWALLKREAVPVRTGPERTLFNTFSGSGNLDKGILRNDDLSIETDFLKAHGKGTLDLGTKALDYRLVAAVYKLPAAGAGSEMRDLKAADIPLLVTGSLADMKVRPDLQALAEGLARQKVNEKVQEKSDELKKKLGDKLKDLLGR